MLRALDILFVVFHTALVVFNLTGWAAPRLRRANLVTLALTGLSWGGLGFFYGFGYCPFTDWHWMVLRRLGETDLPASYIRYLFIRLMGLRIDAAVVDTGVLLTFLAALAVSLVLNIRDMHTRGAG
ncbi:MAG: DUF2784 family protein [Spirochaetaceae bacterium]